MKTFIFRSFNETLVIDWCPCFKLSSVLGDGKTVEQLEMLDVFQLLSVQMPLKVVFKKKS